MKRVIDRHQGSIVDARSPEDFAKSHLPGAVNIPAGRAAELAPQLLPDKNALIVTYCVNFTWKLSEQLARELIAIGYKKIRNYQEGRQDWMKAGLPLEGTAPYEPIPSFHPSANETEAQDQIRQAG
ncbi:MAG TPA: rhodanese-like domain-containing protein [Terriglobales bacterium]|nr:rhodanese-like domain-containing protein [Terriglobales bacterium]